MHLSIFTPRARFLGIPATCHGVLTSVRHKPGCSAKDRLTSQQCIFTIISNSTKVVSKT